MQWFIILAWTMARKLFMKRQSCRMHPHRHFLHNAPCEDLVQCWTASTTSCIELDLAAISCSSLQGQRSCSWKSHTLVISCCHARASVAVAVREQQRQCYHRSKQNHPSSPLQRLRHQRCDKRRRRPTQRRAGVRTSKPKYRS